MGSKEQSSPPHAIIFPFMAKGHTLPLLDLARVLLHRHVEVTIFTTPANRPFITQTLEDTGATVIDLPFPSDAAEIPAGVESTDKLPSMSLFTAFVTATSLMKPHFERALQHLSRVTFMVSDAFLWWTLDSASKFCFHRFVFYGMSNYSHALTHQVFQTRLLSLSGPHPMDELFTLTHFPSITLSKNDFDPVLFDQDPNNAFAVFLKSVRTATFSSYGRIVNSFYELEPVFTDYVNAELSPKTLCIGPLFLAARPSPINKTHEKPPVWVTWLDQKVEEKCGVVYVAFGSQAEISREQLEEIAIGLEESRVSFLWVIRKDEWGLPCGFEERVRVRVRGRGIVIREWVDQREILMHQSVEGFVSHCGWNSVLESVCAGVPIAAWPLMAEQFLNARMVEEELKVGLRVETCDGSVRGFVKREGFKKTLIEIMEGQKGKKAKVKVKELAEMARKAVKEGGSSWSTLNSLLHEGCNNPVEV